VHGLGAAAGLALALSGLYAGNNQDTFGHLAQGREILALGHVPTIDSFSLQSPPQAFINYEWLSDLLYAVLDARFGYDGLLALKCLALFITGHCLTLLATRLAGPMAAYTTPLVICSAIPAIRFRLSDRPHVLGTALAAVTLLGLGSAMIGSTSLALAGADTWTTRIRAGFVQIGPWRLLGLWAVQVTWVNMHGSHLLGTAMVAACVILGPRDARFGLGALLFAHALAACVSPYGPRIVLDALAHVFDPRYRQLISEWQGWRDVDAPWLSLGPVLQVALVTLAGPRALRENRLLWPFAGITALLAFSAFRSIRFVGELCLLSAPLLGAALVPWCAGVHRRVVMPPAFACVIALSIWGASVLPPYRGLGHGAFFQDRPKGAGAWLAAHHPSARVMASMEDGWFLMSMLPGARFVVDGRSTFYGADYLSELAQDFADPRRYVQRIARDRVDAVILRFTQESELGLVAALEHHPAFVRTLVENDHVLYVRRGPGSPQVATLPLAYDLGWLSLAHAESAPAQAAELARYARLPNTEGYVAFYRGVGLLRSLARPGEHNGLRVPVTLEETACLAQALPHVESAQRALPHVPAVAVLTALVRTLRCDLQGARHALDIARADQESRETLFVAQEIAAREGDTAGIAAFIQAAERDPRAAGDAWLADLRRMQTIRPDCGATR
jgi:hypothetical protein